MEMLKYLLVLLVFIPSFANASAPSRAYNYVSHATIDPTQNNTNETALYSYLQAGVDTYAAGSITGTAISSTAAIPYGSLNLLGNVKNADIATGAGIVASKLDLTSPGAIGSGTPNTGSFTNMTISGTLNVGSTHQGDILYDNGTNIVRLTPGTSGQVLQTQGASANPTWGTPGFVPNNIQVFTANGTWTKPAGVSQVYVKVWGGGGSGGDANSGSGNSGPGGGSGGYAEGIVSVSGNVTVTVGASATGDCTAGNLSSFAGSVTVTANGANACTGGGSPAAGTGGTASNGSINITGFTGSSGGAGVLGLNSGANSPFGAGQGGQLNVVNNRAGSNAQGYGAGGAGSTGTSNSYGNGAPGLVIVYY